MEQENEARPPARLPGGIRLSDAERDAAASRICAAFAVGCITAEDLNERLEQAGRAKVHGDLTELLWDLPPAPTSDRPVPDRGCPKPRRVSAALFGVKRYNGPWQVPRELVVAAVAGGVVLDLREASFTGPTVTVRAFGVLGMLKVIVPPGVEVVNSDEKAVSAPGARGTGPLVRILGGGVLGLTLVEADAPAPSWSRRRSVHGWVIRIR